MRPAAVVLILGLALMLIVAILLAQSMFIIHRVAVIDAVDGPAVLRPRGADGQVSLEPGKLVKAGDVIQTGPGGGVDLRWAGWAGGMRVRIGPSTVFTVTRAIVNRSSGAEESRLRIDEGTIWIRLRRALTGKSKFEVETPTAVAAVRGTIFMVSVAADGTSRVSVWEGAVSVSQGRGREITVPGGSNLTARPDAPITAPQPISAEETDEWLSQVSLLGPFLIVDSPPEGASLDASSCTISGRAEPDSVVSIDDTAVPLSEDGSFAATIALAEGENTITVTAVAPDGQQTSVARSIFVTPP